MNTSPARQLDELDYDGLNAALEAEHKHAGKPFTRVKKGTFHKWLGKKPGEKLTAIDIQRGLNSSEPHIRKMAQFAKNARQFKHHQHAHEALAEPAWSAWARQ